MDSSQLDIVERKQHICVVPHVEENFGYLLRLENRGQAHKARTKRFRLLVLHRLILHLDVAVAVAVRNFHIHICSERLQAHDPHIDEVDLFEGPVVDRDEGDVAVATEVLTMDVEVQVRWEGCAHAETRKEVPEFVRRRDPLWEYQVVWRHDGWPRGCCTRTGWLRPMGQGGE